MWIPCLFTILWWCCMFEWDYFWRSNVPVVNNNNFTCQWCNHALNGATSKNKWKIITSTPSQMLHTVTGHKCSKEGFLWVGISAVFPFFLNFRCRSNYIQHASARPLVQWVYATESHSERVPNELPLPWPGPLCCCNGLLSLASDNAVLCAVVNDRESSCNWSCVAP